MRSSRSERARRGAGIAGALLLAACAAAEPGPGPARAVSPEPGWDAAFTRSAGWTGADGDYSLDLGDGRVLWLFSDTWIGPVREGRHAQGATLVNNTLAVQPRGEAPPDPGALEFVWREEGGRPAAWIAPEGGQGWFWLGDALVVPGGPRGRRLVVFLQHIGPRPGVEGPWAFQQLGSTLAVVDDLAGSPAAWRARQVPLPHAGPETSWGAAALLLEEPDGPQAYVYGVREAPPDKLLLLARAPAAALVDPAAWRFWDGRGWSPDLARAAPVATGLVNELSVDALTVEGEARLLMVHSQPWFGDQVLCRAARRPQGPWSDPVALLRVDEVRRHPTYFTYAAKAHLELSRPDALLVSWILNAHDFAVMAGDAAIYRPRFASVPRAALPAPP